VASPIPRVPREQTDRPGLGRRFTLVTLFGFRVQIDASWLLLALLVSWSLAAAFFPPQYPGLDRNIYWWMGIAGTVGLLFSLIFHELSHSLVARRYGLRIRGITLFIFGGVAEMAEEPPSAVAELLMALAGPAASLLLAAVFEAVADLTIKLGWPTPITGVAKYLALINAVLAVFNLIPAFPLDGGRVFRAALWWWKGDLHWATLHASRVGGGFAFLLMALGVLQVMNGNFVAGMWWFLIGLFLRSAASSSYVQLLTREMLAGAPVARYMTKTPIAVPAEATVAALVEDYIYQHHHEQFPVVDGERLTGVVGVRQVKAVPRAEWPSRHVAEIAEPLSPMNAIEANADAAEALALMSRNDTSRLVVTERGRLVGILTLKDLLKLLSLRMEIEKTS